MTLGTYVGKDNYGKPKHQYLDRIAGMTDDELYTETKNKIWLSAYAQSNPRSDYHWHADACYDECSRRGGEIYDRAYQAVAND